MKYSVQVKPVPKRSKELANAVYDDWKRKAIDSAKKRAVAQFVDYETFKNMVSVAHLKAIGETCEATGATSTLNMAQHRCRESRRSSFIWWVERPDNVKNCHNKISHEYYIIIVTTDINMERFSLEIENASRAVPFVSITVVL